MLVNDPAAAHVDLSHWKVLIGGAALPRTVALTALARGIDVSVGYGLSESCPVLAIASLSADQLKLRLEEQAELRMPHGHADRAGRHEGGR